MNLHPLIDAILKTKGSLNMSYFNDFQARRRVIAEDVFYTYNPEKFTQDIHFDPQNGFEPNKEMHVPKNSVVLSEFPTIAAIQNKSELTIMSAAEFALIHYGHHRHHEYNQYNIFINVARQMGLLFDVLVDKYNHENNTNIKVHDVIDVNQFNDLFMYFIKHLPTFQRHVEVNQLDNPRYDGDCMYDNDYSIISNCLKELKKYDAEFDEFALKNLVFFQVIQKDIKPRFVTAQTIDDYINTFEKAYQNAKPLLAHIDDGGYTEDLNDIVIKLKHIRATLSFDMKKYPDGLINTHNGQFWTYYDLIRYFRRYDDVMDYKTSIAYKSICSARTNHR